MIRAPFGLPPTGAEIEAAMLANNDRMTTRLALEAAVRYGNAGDLESSAASVALLLAVSGLGGAVRVRVVLEVDGVPHVPRCYAVDDPATFPGDEDWPMICRMDFYPGTDLCCPEVNEAKFKLTIERLQRGEDARAPDLIKDDPIAATTSEARAMVVPATVSA